MHLKKYILLLILFLFPFNVYAYTDTSRSSIVMDIDSGRVLYEKNANEKKLIASITKIMTAVIAIEKGDLTKTVTVEEEVLKMYGTNIYVEVGEKLKLEDLLYGLLLRSGNDASVVIAKNVAGSEEKFVEMMNNKAQELGMKNTIFSNPHGLDEETQNYSTAYDMSLLSRYAYKNKTYRKISSTKKYEVSTGEKTYLWYNRNKLINNYEFCTGGKNGYTPSAGKTLVTTATKNNTNLTIVTLDNGDEYTAHRELYEEFFSKYKKYEIVSKEEFKIDKELLKDDVYIKKSFYYPLTESEIDDIKTVISMDSSINGEIVGEINIYLKEEKIGNINIYRKEKKKEVSFFNKIKNYLLDNLKKLILG